MKVQVPISLGELFDKVSILEIKMENIGDPRKIINVRDEREKLYAIVGNFPIDQKLYIDLLNVNKKIWEVEDNIRECERNKNFGKKFIELARSIYYMNDERSRIKKEINLRYGSEIIEEKSYKSYHESRTDNQE